MADEEPDTVLSAIELALLAAKLGEGLMELAEKQGEVSKEEREVVAGDIRRNRDRLDQLVAEARARRGS